MSYGCRTVTLKTRCPETTRIALPDSNVIICGVKEQLVTFDHFLRNVFPIKVQSHYVSEVIYILIS